MKRLSLRKELLTELSADELNFVGANIPTLLNVCNTRITYTCLTACDGNSCFCSIGGNCTNTCGCGDLPLPQSLLCR